MASTMDDCVLDFDIDLLQQLPKYDVEKTQKSVRLMKTKVTSTNSLLKKYYNKGVICKTLENYLLATKESYKQVCIERMEFREKCAVLEEEIKKLHKANKELEEKYIAADNQYDGMQSHSKQLALLVQENETTIEALKIENQLEKCTVKDYEKKFAALQKENDHLVKNIRSIRDIVLGKKTATKEIKSFLNKYSKAKNVSQEVTSSDEIDGFDECLSPLSDRAEYKQVQPSAVGNKNAVKLQNTNITEENNGDDNDHDSESSNEVVSSDTGRGSSLTFSDSDKCSLLSPEYYIQDSPLDTEVIRQTDKMVVSIATSPILIREYTSVATSPIVFEHHDFSGKMHSDDCDQSLMNSSQKKLQTNNCVPIIMIDRIVSPIFATQYVDMATSTDRNKNCDAGTSPLKPDDRRLDCNYDSDEDHNTQEQECLNINSSNHLIDESSNDGEIQMILDKMRFHQKLITPIPTTPAKSRTLAATNIATQTSLHAGGVCPDVAKLREENISLQTAVAKLSQEVMNINNFLNKCGYLVNNGTAINSEVQTKIQDKYLMALGEEVNVQNQQIELKIPIAQKNESIDTEAKKPLSFKGKISKFKKLFDDALPLRPSDGLMLHPPIMSDCDPSPAPAPALSPPPQSSPSALSPVSSIADTDINVFNNNNNTIEGDQSFNSKARLDFEEPKSDNTSSAREITYEHEIVVELTPDSQESDTQSLHEFLKEQQSKPDEAPVKRMRRTKKLTRLEKLRINMAPKSKMQKTKLQEGNTIKKIRIQPKRLTANKQRVQDSDCNSACTAAFEKARRVMAEIRSKEKVLSAPLVAVLDRIPTTPEKDNRKSVEGDIMSFSITENKVGSRVQDSESITGRAVRLEERSQSTIPEKNSPGETGIDLESVDTQNKKTSETALKPLERQKILTSGFKKPGRTRSQSKCIDGIEDKESEVNHFNTNHLTSPSLKSYGRNRTAKKQEINPINNNTLPQVFVQPDAVIPEEHVDTEAVQVERRKRLKRPSIDKPDIVPKRVLRSSSGQPLQNEEENPPALDLPTTTVQTHPDVSKEIVSYDDLDLFANSEVSSKSQAIPEKVMPNIQRDSARPNTGSQKLGILCTFLDKYGTKYIKRAPKISESMTNAVCKQLEDSIADIQKLPPKDTRPAMDELVKDLHSRLPNHVLTGLIKFLKEPARKIESYNKINVPPAPPMTKVEQIVIYIVAQLNVLWPEYKLVDSILNYIEYTLFMLNRTPEFDVIETLSHFYAILCRYDKSRNRLRLFIIDAMYCLQYKAVPLIRQCLDVWMHILPLAHLGIAKNPLVTCLVYLLHFYKCEDKFNRVQDIRNILRRKYFYEVTDWNEPGILDMFRNAIMELRENASEKKMLRMALIILAKRNGARWCQKHIVKNMLLPIAEQADIPDRIRNFCVGLLGPLLKPYPMEMKVNCEVVMNQLFDMLTRNPTTQMEEAIYTSLLYMSRHNQHRVIKALLNWTPERVSPELEELLKNYVKERPIKAWKQVLSKIYSQN